MSLYKLTFTTSDGRVLDAGTIDIVQGSQGANGVDGIDGETITGASINESGQLVITTNTNNTFTTTESIKGTVITSAVINGLGELVIYYEDGNYENVGLVKGENGLNGRPFELQGEFEAWNQLSIFPDASSIRPYFYICRSTETDYSPYTVKDLTDQVVTGSLSGHLISANNTNLELIDNGSFTGVPGAQGIQGIQGYNGWTPVFTSEVRYDDALVLKLTDWIGGTGTKPLISPTLKYIGSNALTFVSIEYATDFRGAKGNPGIDGINITIEGSSMIDVSAGNNYIITHLSSPGMKHIPSAGSPGQAVVYGGTSGTGQWGTLDHNSLSNKEGGDGTVYKHLSEIHHNKLTTSINADTIHSHSHANLSDKNIEPEFQHLSNLQYTGLTNSANTTLHKHSHNNLDDLDSSTTYLHLTSAQKTTLTTQVNAETLHSHYKANVVATTFPPPGNIINVNNSVDYTGSLSANTTCTVTVGHSDSTVFLDILANSYTLTLTSGSYVFKGDISSGLVQNLATGGKRTLIGLHYIGNTNTIWVKTLKEK